MEKSNTSGEKSKSPDHEHDDFNSSIDNNFLQKPIAPLKVMNNCGDGKLFEIESDTSPNQEK